MRTLLATLAALMLFATSVKAGEFEDGVAAYKVGDYQKAFRLWKPFAEQGDAQAQNSLGKMYSLGGGVLKDDAKAVHWYRKAAQQGHAKAQFCLGVMYGKGRGVPEEFETSYAWIIVAAAQGYKTVWSCNDAKLFKNFLIKKYEASDEQISEAQKLAEKYWESYVVPSLEELTKVSKIYKAAEQGDARAQYNLGKSYNKGRGIPEHYSKAVHWYRKSAEQGHAEAQSALAVMYGKGRGVPEEFETSYAWIIVAAAQGYKTRKARLFKKLLIKNEEPSDEQISEAQNLAEKYWESYVVPSLEEPTKVSVVYKAAEQGDARAQYNLGKSYNEGEGIPEHYSKAVHWYRKSAEQGHAEAQSALGVMYGKGTGVREDDAKAIYWTRKAAEQGYPEGQNNLGNKYDTGEGISEDDVKAIYWYRKAAEQGYAIAQSNLGWMYHYGTGVPESTIQAYAWWSLAAEQGYGRAKVFKTLKKYLMTDQQIEDAENLISEYLEMYVVPFQK